METTDGLTWEVRYTWQTSAGIVHPQHTYERRHDETAAIDAAVNAMDRHEGKHDLRLIAAHVREAGGHRWQKVE